MKSKRIFILLFVLSFTIFLVHFLIVEKAIYGDGRYYYSYLPAFLIQHTFNLSSAFEHTDIPVWALTPLHLPANIYPIGSALFWTIPYLLAFGFSFIFGYSNMFSVLFQIPIGAFVICLSTFGLWLLFKSLEKFFPPSIALLSVLTVFFTTNLLFYGSVDVLNSHPITFFLSCVFLFFWLKRPTLGNAIVIGVAYGLLMLVRPQEILFGILLASSILRKNEKKYIFSFITAALIFLPQLLLWKVEWGSWYINPYLHAATFNFLKPELVGVLFNTQSGLFLWTPITLLAFIGLFLFAKDYKVAIPMILLILLELYIISSWSIWWEGKSYSARMLISSLPFLSFGLAYIYEKIRSKTLLYSIPVFFGVLNVVLIFYFLVQK